MTITFPELPGWSFDYEEVSASVYRVFGGDRSARTVEAVGLDPDALIDQCKKKALQMVGADLQSGDRT